MIFDNIKIYDVMFYIMITKKVKTKHKEHILLMHVANNIHINKRITKQRN